MTNLKTFKTKRAALRRTIANYIKKIENIIAVYEININDLEENIELLKQKETELKKIDREIEILIKDTKQLESEIDGAQEISDKIDLWKFKGEKILKVQNAQLNKSENKSSVVTEHVF